MIEIDGAKLTAHFYKIYILKTVEVIVDVKAKSMGFHQISPRQELTGGNKLILELDLV